MICDPDFAHSLVITNTTRPARTRDAGRRGIRHTKYKFNAGVDCGDNHFIW